MIAVAIALLLGQTATTNCRDTFFGAPQLGQTCETTVQGGQPADKARCAGKDFLFLGCTFTAHKEAKVYKVLAEKVSELAKAGDCKGAINTALDAGEIDLAKATKEYCDLRAY